MAWKELRFRIVGDAPLLMHSGALADPLNRFSRAMKEITGKRPKTDADLEELARLEWLGGLYLTDGKPCIPGQVVEAMMVTAAKKRRKGQQAQAGLLCPENALVEFPDQEKPIELLWGEERYRLTCGARVQRNRIMRTRPVFPEWAADIMIQFDDEQLSEREIVTMLDIAGANIGLMDWRPKFGRFHVENGK